MATDSRSRRSSLRFVVWVALGTALSMTSGWALFSAVAVNGSTFRRSIESIGLSHDEAARPAAAVAQDLRTQLLWAGSLALLGLAGWILASVRLRQRRSGLARRRSRLVVIGIVVGILGSSVVTFTLMLIAYAITSPSLSTF